MEWLPALLDLVVRVVQISAGLALAYGGYLVTLQMSAEHGNDRHRRAVVGPSEWRILQGERI